MDLLWLGFGGLVAFVAMALMSHERQRRLNVREIEQQQRLLAEAQSAATETAEPIEAPVESPTPSRKAA